MFRARLYRSPDKRRHVQAFCFGDALQMRVISNLLASRVVELELETIRSAHGDLETDTRSTALGRLTFLLPGHRWLHRKRSTSCG